jgi:hypothetical protein
MTVKPFSSAEATSPELTFALKYSMSFTGFSSAFFVTYENMLCNGTVAAMEKLCAVSAALSRCNIMLLRRWPNRFSRV